MTMKVAALLLSFGITFSSGWIPLSRTSRSEYYSGVKAQEPEASCSISTTITSSGGGTQPPQQNDASGDAAAAVTSIKTSITTSDSSPSLPPPRSQSEIMPPSPPQIFWFQHVVTVTAPSRGCHLITGEILKVAEPDLS